MAPCQSIHHLLLTTHQLLYHHRRTLCHDENLIFDATKAGGGEQTRRRLIERFVSQTEASVMHRHQSLTAQFLECLDRLLRIHVNFATRRRVVGADGKQRDIDRVALANFLESRKVGTVAAMKNRAVIDGDNESTKVAMQIREKTR